MQTGKPGRGRIYNSITETIGDTPLVRIHRMAEEAGVSYFIAQFSFGDLSHEEVMRSAGIFASEVIPAQARLARAS